MSRPCTVCSHTQREAIDRALVAGEPCTTVAAGSFTLSARMAIQRLATRGRELEGVVGITVLTGQQPLLSTPDPLVLDSATDQDSSRV
jgi:hypothetical protein